MLAKEGGLGGLDGACSDTIPLSSVVWSCWHWLRSGEVSGMVGGTTPLPSWDSGTPRDSAGEIRDAVATESSVKSSCFPSSPSFRSDRTSSDTLGSSRLDDMMDMCRRGNVVSVDGANDMIGKKTIVLHGPVSTVPLRSP